MSKVIEASRKTSDNMMASQKLGRKKMMKGEGKPVDFVEYAKLKAEMILFQSELPSIVRSLEVTFYS